MVSVVTAEEIETLKRKLESTSKRVKHDKNEALRVLKAAGILDETGEFTEPYRATAD